MTDEFDSRSELTEEEFDRLSRILPGESLSRYLSQLGNGRELLDALSEPLGKEFLGRLNRKILECENYILNNISVDGKDSPEMIEKKLRFRIYKEEADHVLSRVKEYYRIARTMKDLATKKEGN